MYFLTPQGRLDIIVTEQRLLAKPQFGSSRRTVCLSESDPAGVAALVGMGQFAGWGLAVRRDWAWSRGGGPIWYTRNEVWQSVYERNDQELLQWMVRTSPQDADWLHEREWRIPSTDEYVELEEDGVVALIVADPDWEPYRPTVVIPKPTGQAALAEVTNPLACAVPRWYWDGREVTVLPPIPDTERIIGFVD